MTDIRVHTSGVIEKIYPTSFANSVHLTLASGEAERVLNQGYGVLYAKAAIREDDTLMERGIRGPAVYADGGGYAILAEIVDVNGEWIDRDKLLLWRTANFVDFDEQQEVSRADYETQYQAAGDRIALPDHMVQPIVDRWVPLQSVRAEVPAEVEVRSIDELRGITARVIYSDGSCDEKRIRWNEDDVLALCPGETRTVRGAILPVSPVFPQAVGYADPVLFQWQGSWYFLATNDNLNDIGLYLRKAPAIDALFDGTAEERCILAPDEAGRFVQTFWAPEFHVIGGAAYILFAVSNAQWGPQCHIMRLKNGCDPIDPASWEDPIRVRRMDGSMPTEDGITLDMTFIRAGRKCYLAWSYRRHIGTPKDTGSMIYIAETTEETPWMLASEPVLLTRPLYGWENTCGTINNEGPYALCHGGKVYLGYSGGDACGYFYVIGYLVADEDADLTDLTAWRKLPSPMLASTFVEGIQGPGHHSFFRDEEGRWMIAYHAQEREKHFCRCSTYHRVHFAASGLPVLNVTGERDVKREMQTISARVTLR